MDDKPQGTHTERTVSTILRALPTLAVFALLGGLYLWGHSTGWRIPSYAAVTGANDGDEKPWCPEHSVAAHDCVLCNPKSPHRPKPHGWCRKHGVFDCPFEHPEIAQSPTQPKLTTGMLDRADKSLAFTQRPENSERCKLHPAVVQLASRDVFFKLNLDHRPVKLAPIEETIQANGEIVYDQTRVAALSSIVRGQVSRVTSQIGDVVKQGDVLAIIDSAAVGKAKAEFLKAVAEVELYRKNLKKLKPLAPTAVPVVTILELETALTKAEANLVSSEQALKNIGIPADADDYWNLSSRERNEELQFLGLPKSVTESLSSQTSTANLIALRASMDGVVVERNAVAGELVDPARKLFTLANTDTMWLVMHIPLKDLSLVQLGKPVRFRVNNKTQLKGAVSWISTAVDDKTRTVKVRAEIANPNGLLKANTFGDATVVLRREDKAIVVPRDAVHSDGNCQIVFVQDIDFHKTGHPKLYHVRTVRTGAIDSENIEIIAGVLPGEMVVFQGGGVLRAQLLRNNLGAG